MNHPYKISINTFTRDKGNKSFEKICQVDEVGCGMGSHWQLHLIKVTACIIGFKSEKGAHISLRPILS